MWTTRIPILARVFGRRIRRIESGRMYEFVHWRGILYIYKESRYAAN